ncbi:hypothetical protein PC129_g23616 [Phytophthora cactorum]|uniref:Uncharacterized protein n=2 Tax=Phytophthora cactorum TaxID=29920 RepID=A0A8T1GXM8_9STRA|nr:hypothetical protein Pcac1_g13828 [Phytophthora cactorum]KAG2870563.1 hypothetical protein PC114_g27328 [Phytophthora cactorum]KAG2959742.1 hypothetical protein PC119_g26616 [Phytophthora cactorum]KAG2966442.1 hypothetical protein PC120_g27101 [Phytophthora cactorum]KAG3115884.1 hypothetical protein C6341_g27632 [Phytophthora cactorum]
MEERGIVVWGPTETRIRYIMFVLLQDVYSRSEMRLIRRPCKEIFSRMFRSFVTKRLACFSSRFQDGGCCCQLTGCRIQEVDEILRALGRPHFHV